MWPRSQNFPLYHWYVIKDNWDELDVWLMKVKTKENKECTIKTNIIKLEHKHDYKELRNGY